MKNLRSAHVQSIYRPISIAFLVLVVLSMLGVAYTSWSSSTVTITPLQVAETATFPVTIAPTAINDSTLIGQVTTASQKASVTVTPKGTGNPVPAHASGEVKILNTTAKDQPLTSGTRLQSETGIIVRTTARVDVPAGGSVTAHVVADPLGESGNLAPGKFTIVALWPGLQDKIYGQSSTAFTGGLAVGGVSLSLDELTAASDQAEKKIRDALGPDQPGVFTSLDPASVVSDPKPEVSSATYVVTVTMDVTTVTFDAKVLDQLQRQELTKSLPDGLELATLGTPFIKVQDRPTKDQIVLSIKATGTAHLAGKATSIQPSAFIGLSADAIRTRLISSGNVKTVDVKLEPFWRTTMPDQADHITVKINPAIAAAH